MAEVFLPAASAFLFSIGVSGSISSAGSSLVSLLAVNSTARNPLCFIFFSAFFTRSSVHFILSPSRRCIQVYKIRWPNHKL